MSKQQTGAKEKTHALVQTTALTKQERESLDALFEKERAAVRHLEWSLTGALSAVSIVVVIVGDVLTDIVLPTIIGMPLSMALMLALHLGAKAIVRRLPIPMNNRTPVVWPIMSDERIFAYASSMEDRVTALAKAAGDKTDVTEKLTRVKAALDVELAAYRRAATDLKELETKKTQRTGREVKTMSDDLNELTKRRDRAEAHVNQCLDAYDALVSRYMLQRNGTDASDVSGLIDDLLTSIGKKDEFAKVGEEEVEKLVPTEVVPSQT